VYQNYVGPPPGTYGCTATIASPTHPFLENTLPSIREAFRVGATMVEVDIHRTSDGHLVVFHDYRLECRTNGTGATNSRPLAYLKRLDVGYGYSVAGRFPFRGKGVGMMPTLAQVLDAFPDRRFLIDEKDGATRTARLLGRELRRRPPSQRRRLFFWGHREHFEQVASQAPGVRFFGNRREVKRCVRDFAKQLFLGELPDACRNRIIGLPYGYLAFAPGWPNRLLRKVRAAGAMFYVNDVNTPQQVADLRSLAVDGIVTERVEVVGLLIR
jgi:glycerophosphoryl diester phosphodiesterase